MNHLETAVFTTIVRSKAKSLLVAVSGGADSVALLVATSRLSPRLGLRVEAVNCNFHLRGEESDRDSEFTANLCKSLGVKLHTLEYDVTNYLQSHSEMSLEMACRELRYADFFRIMEQEGFDRVAVAHNSDDDIETMMLNMLRGSGTRGLKGMDQDNGRVIRPLLDVSRKEIEKYLNSLSIEFVTDSSNLSSEFRRNFIRRDIIPLIESRWPSARKTLSKTVGILKEEAEIIEDYYTTQLRDLSPRKGTLFIYSDDIKTGTVVRFLEPYGGNPEIAEEILDALHKDFEQRTWHLSERHKAILERDRLIIFDSECKDTFPEFIWTRLEMNPALMTEIKANSDHNIIYLPHDESAYILRPAKTGDRMAPLGMRGTRLVSDIISDARLDRLKKCQIRVLERKSDGEIIWVAGLKRSRHDLIKETAQCCFKVERQLQTELSFNP